MRRYVEPMQPAGDREGGPKAQIWTDARAKPDEGLKGRAQKAPSGRLVQLWADDRSSMNMALSAAGRMFTATFSAFSERSSFRSWPQTFMVNSGVEYLASAWVFS